MRDMQSLAMRRYAEAARAHHNMHPEDEIALHEHHLNSLPFKPKAREHVVNKGLASVAAYVAGNDGLRKQMEGMTDEDQIKAIQAIHEAERSGREGELGDQGEYINDKERTEAYIRERKQNRSRR